MQIHARAPGEEFAGAVSSVTTFGIFVTLDAMYVEGLVHITELGGDYFRFDEARQELRGERSGVRYGIGTRVRVQVSRVDLDGRRIDFRLVRDGEDAIMQSPRRGAGKEEVRGRREPRDQRDDRAGGSYAEKWSRRDAKVNRAQRNTAGAVVDANGGKQGRKAAKKAMLKGVNLAALEAEYAQDGMAAKPAVAPVLASKPVAAASPRKAAGKKKVAALLVVMLLQPNRSCRQRYLTRPSPSSVPRRLLRPRKLPSARPSVKHSVYYCQGRKGKRPCLQ